jgi:sorbitol-specific phosphotransferase system component IIA
MGDNKDNRGTIEHLVHAGGHYVNAKMKELGHPGIETTSSYKSHSPGKAAKGPWDKKVDYNRAEYHYNEAFKKKK